MDKKQYRKPIIGFEQFAPNQYVADCWFVAEGDCYEELYADNLENGTYGRYDNNYRRRVNEHIVQNHGSHKIPTNGFLKSDVTPEPTKPIDYNYYIFNGEFEPEDETPYDLNQGGIKLFTQVYPYKFEYEGVTHYLKQISYSPNRNQS